MSDRPAISQPQAAASGPGLPAGSIEDQMEVAALDIALQLAVKSNDAATIDRILCDQFAMVMGDGRVVSRAEILDSARAGAIKYEIQDEDPDTQTVRVWGDTAVVTARLHIRGRKGAERFERKVWFSDTYVRTADGWRYAFAQVSLPLPHDAYL